MQPILQWSMILLGLALGCTWGGYTGLLLSLASMLAGLSIIMLTCCQVTTSLHPQVCSCTCRGASAAAPGDWTARWRSSRAPTLASARSPRRTSAGAAPGSSCSAETWAGPNPPPRTFGEKGVNDTFRNMYFIFTSSVQERDQGRCERGEDGPGEPGEHLRLRGEAQEERGEGGHPGQQRRRHDVSPQQDRGRLRDADRNKSFWPLLSHQPSSAND